jgi:alpha-tubulin suppressor-like RCC1 family protein
MLIVLLSAVGASSSIRSSLDSLYYNQIAREATESGINMATACLEQGAYIAQWSNASPLRPNTSCTGGAACTNAPSCFVISAKNVRTTFEVGAPANQTVSQSVVAKAKVELLRSSDGSVWRTFTNETVARVGIDLNLSTVAFGYMGYNGAYFATIAADGKTRGVGWNNSGQLGNGSFAATSTPKEFQLPETERAAALFSNFVSGGRQLFAITNNGDLYGAGSNEYGQLGDGSKTTRTIPVKYNLGTKKAKSVAFNGDTTYVLTTDNNIFSSGRCNDGALGQGGALTPCTDNPTPTRVALPPVNLSDANTLPTTNIVSDWKTTFVRMQGGRVYAWGINDRGQLANGTGTSSTTPIQVGTYGNVGMPKATQVASDGTTVWIRDDTGNVKAAGYNDNGSQLIGKGVTIQNWGSARCLENNGGDSVTLWADSCNSTDVLQQWTFRSDGTIYLPNKNRCLDNTALDGVRAALYTCNTSAAQKFRLQDNGSILLINHNKCLSDINNNGSLFQFATCDGTNKQRFFLPDQRTLVDVNLPTGVGTVTKIATDQWYTAFLMSSGEVWSAGVNNCGQLGNGTTAVRQPYPVKFQLPAGVTAIDVNVSSFNTLDAACRYNNIFVIGSDGKVYGSGSNYFGQLGNGTTTSSTVPVAMSVIDGVNIKAKQVVSGYGTTVVLTTGNKVYTVGNNENGQLGDGTTTNSSIPKANRYTNVLRVTNF